MFDQVGSVIARFYCTLLIAFLLLVPTHFFNFVYDLLLLKNVDVKMMEDILSKGQLKVSSNEAMCGSLTDGATDTFWESRDEPKTQPKKLTVTFEKEMPIFGIAIHIDNQKDDGVRANVNYLHVQYACTVELF